ncbi:TPM domain-containing protein [Thermococcus camini]|uniref:Uncharacterized protein n=1 Tax=Thermococcus camini TaxID=2016373 RepID=A0A7G2D907_9EURY|nr:TPM domain-containing protein [Thermococcus camini]CAD5243406.1 conserved protein of unknown function [Thermococcus camini]
MRRRGFVFTLDAVLAILLVTMFVVSMVQVTSTSSQVYSTYMRSQSKYLAEDTLTMLRTVPLRELVPPEKLEEWTSGSDPILNTTLVTPDMSPIDIVSTYWATDPLYPGVDLKHKAEIIMGYVLNNTLKGYNYEMMINDYTSPYLKKTGSDSSTAPDVIPATLLISGYAYNQTPRGYMARAFLTKAEYTRQDIFGIQRVLARCHYADEYGRARANTLTVQSHFRLPNDADIEKADIRLVARTGYQTSSFDLNGHSLSTGYYNNIKGYLQGGDNVLTATFSTRYSTRYCYELGYGSGSLMYVKYSTNTTSFQLFDPVRRYGELYDVTSHTGIYYLNALFAPGNITGISLHLVTEGVRNINIYYSYGSNNYWIAYRNVSPTGVQTVDISAQEIEQNLTEWGFSLNDLSKTYFKIVIALDAEWDAQHRYFIYNTTGKERRLYGNGQSWIRIDYVPRTVVSRYAIPLSIFKDYNQISYGGTCYGIRCQRMSFSYNLPPKSIPWYVDVWTAIQFTTFTPTATTTLSENGQVFYDDYSDIYMIRVGYSQLNDNMMVPGQSNTYVAESSDSYQYGFRNGESRAIINYFIEGYAGYGDVFPKPLQGYPGYNGYRLTYYYSKGGGTYERTILIGDSPYLDITVDDLDPTRYAVDDAILRLFNNLNFLADTDPNGWKSQPFDGSQNNPIDVDLPESVRIDFVSMGNIPGLFEPISITLRVWREGG